jgi:hypothetical protein
LGDYSVAGLEDHCVVERKDLADLVHSLTTERSVFVNRLRRMSRYPHRLLVITAALSEVKSPPDLYRRQSESRHSVADCRACWAPDSLPLQRDARTRRGTGCVLPLSGPSLPLA